MSSTLLNGLFATTDLHEAVVAGDVERAQTLLREGADVNARAFQAATPLMDACGSEAVTMRALTRPLLEKLAGKPANVPSVLSGSDTEPLTLKNFPVLDPKTIFAEMKNRKPQHDDTLPADDPTLATLLIQQGADVDAVDESGQSALMKAAQAGRIETAHVLLEHGADLRACDNEHQTPLTLAARSRRLGVVEFLLAAGADADYRTPEGKTTLIAAADGGRVEIAQRLMAHGQDVNTADVNGSTALLRAALHGHDEMIAFLKTAGANVGFLEAIVLNDMVTAESLTVPERRERGPKWGWTALQWAVKQGLPDVVRLLLARGVNANATTSLGSSALLKAVMREDMACASLLLEAGADPNGISERHFTPLGMAGRHGYTEMMNLLLEHGANPNAASTDGNTALRNTVMAGNLNAARRLLDAGADPNAKVVEEMPLLAFATARGDKATVQLLLDRGAKQELNESKINLTRVMARSQPEIAAMLKQASGVSLHQLAKEGKTEALLSALDAGADLQARGELDVTLLIAALRGKQPETARTLIERGADIHAIDQIGQTALICAAASNDLATARQLLARGANVAVADKPGQTALLRASLANHREMVALLIDAGASVGPVEAALLGDLALLRQRLNAGAEVETRTPGGMTPLMGAATGGHCEIITALLTRRADINATDEEGQTALAWAVKYKRHDAIHLLLDSGADVNLAGENRYWRRSMEERMQQHDSGVQELFKARLPRSGATPFGCAVTYDEPDLAALLLDRGANINAPGITGTNTPLYTAAMMGKLPMVRFLLEHGADPEIKGDMGDAALEAAEYSENPEVIALLREAREKNDERGS